MDSDSDEDPPAERPPRPLDAASTRVPSEWSNADFDEDEFYLSNTIPPSQVISDPSQRSLGTIDEQASLESHNEDEAEPHHAEQPIIDRRPLRRGTTLYLFFPTPASYQCTEQGCHASYSASVWTTQRQSLERHLLEHHGKRIETREHRCAGCHATLGDRPKTHNANCEASRRIQNEPVNHRFQCPTCNFSCPSKKGLDNHNKKHRRDRLRQRERDIPLREDRSPEASEAGSPPRENGEARQAPPNHQPRQIPSPLIFIGQPPSPAASTVSSADSEGLVIDEDADSNTGDAPQEGLELSQPPVIPDERPPSEISHHSEDQSQVQGVQQTQSTITNPPASQEDTIESQTPQASPNMMHQSPDVSINGEVIEENQQSQPANENDPAEQQWLLEQFYPEVNELLRSPNWDQFESLLNRITEKLQEHYRINLERRHGPRATMDVDDCKKIQRLYRTNRRRAVRLITEGESERCQIPKNDIEAHFTQRMGERHGNLEAVNTLPLPPEDQPTIDLTHFTTSEVKQKVNSAENTSPGADGISYRQWKKADPECRVLTGIFNICLTAKRIPTQWKSSLSILIPKSGDLDTITNWRNITLCNTIYKLYTGCLATRLRMWCIDNNILNPGQKCSLPTDGVLEHNYLLQHYMDKTRREQLNLCIAFLDLSDAFGSVPHDIISATLQRLGAGPDFVSIASDLLSQCTTRFLTREGDSAEIQVQCGVRQGCPISGLLFNISIEALLHNISEKGRQQDRLHSHPCLAYADDITITARQPEHLQELINTAETTCRDLGLTINPVKCSTIHLSGITPRGTRPSVFTIHEQPITARGEGEPTNFLGKPVGFHLLPSATSIDEFIQLGTKILTSKLAPWQRIDALKTFVLPATVYAQRTWQLRKTDWERFDKAMKPLIKKTLSLPPRAANEYLYGSSTAGSLAIPLAAEDSDIFLVDSAFKLLTSRDAALKDITQSDVQDIAARRTGRNPSMPDACVYLSKGEMNNRGGDHQTLWSRARDASGRLQVKWSTDGDDTPRVTTNNITLDCTSRRKIASTIRNQMREHRDAALQEKPSQGKVMKLVAKERASSSFFRDGSFTTFADWRFIHRARLNLLPLNGAQQHRRNNQQCRRCQYPRETLPHVINHCMRHSHAMQLRHNDLVKRVERAAVGRNWRVLQANQRIPDVQDNGRPDLVIEKNREVLIIDITCPFENGEGAFAEARATKEAKYQDLAREMRRNYDRVGVEAFIVGPLGGYDTENERLMRRLASKSYLKMFRRLCVSDVISWSRKIYIEHITGHRQY